MPRTCCRATNAYDATLAIRASFALTARAYSSTGLRSNAALRRPSRPASTILARFTNLRQHGNTRSYASSSAAKANDISEWEEIEEEQRRVPSLDAYESLLGTTLRNNTSASAPSGRQGESADTRIGVGKETALTVRRTPSREEEKTMDGPYAWKKSMQNIKLLAKELPRDDSLDETKKKELLDYEGLSIGAKRSTAANAMPVPWALPAGERSKISATQILDEEIEGFAEFMVLSKAEQEARNSLIRQVSQEIKDTMDSQVYSFLYGSARNGTQMPYSDIDIAVRAKNTAPAALGEQMELLYHRMRERSDFLCVVFRGGQFPIITAQHKHTGIDVQIVASNTSFTYLPVQECLETIPNMHSLYAVVRTMFGVRGLVDPFLGGISAYGLFMMLAASLTRRGTPESIHASPGQQLLHFLSFYANFDPTRHCLSVRAGKVFRKYNPEERGLRHKDLIRAAFARGDPARAGQYSIARIRPLQPYLLCLQDPANPINDLGARCNAIKHILCSIVHLHETVPSRMALHDKSHDQGRQHLSSDEFSFLLPFVGRCHELYAERRQRVEEYGLNFVGDKGERTKKKLWRQKKARERAEARESAGPSKAAEEAETTASEG